MCGLDMGKGYGLYSRIFTMNAKLPPSQTVSLYSTVYYVSNVLSCRLLSTELYFYLEQTQPPAQSRTRKNTNVLIALNSI